MAQIEMNHFNVGMELAKLKNPKAARMMEEAMKLARKALEVEEGRKKCSFCQLEVLGGNLVEHYTSHYSLEQPGLLVKVLVAKNTKVNLRCPLPTCDNQEMEGAKLDLHIATEHDILKAVLEEDARLPEKMVIIKSLFPCEDNLFRVGDNSVSEGLLDPEGLVKVDPDEEIEDNGKEDSEAGGPCEDGEIKDLDSEDRRHSENAKDDLERMFHDAKTVDKIETPIGRMEEENESKELQPKRRRRVKKDSPADWTEKRREKEKLIKEALAQIAAGTPSRVVARQFRLSRNFLAKRVKQEDTRDWVRARYGGQSRVMTKEEESKFAESLRRQFNNLGQLLQWQTLKGLLQRHLQNLVEENPSRLTGFEATNQAPHTRYLRRFVP